MERKKIAIVGGGPSSLFMLKKLIDAASTDLSIHIFEKGNQLGAGMPYSLEGAADEHVTNVSGNEIPELEVAIIDWIKSVHPDTLHRFHIDLERFHEYQVLPRLLFGAYLADQFKHLEKRAVQAGLELSVSYKSEIVDILDMPEKDQVALILADGSKSIHDHVILCSGHLWPKQHEGKVKGYFDSPYPPAKIKLKTNHAVAIRGASLTAIDALRTLARQHGGYELGKDGMLKFQLDEVNPNFNIVMHSREGLLPAIRFHLEESMLGKDSLFDKKEIDEIRQANDGFVPLDLVFEEKFKQPLLERQPALHKEIAGMSMEEFVDHVMELREKLDAFQLFRAEYKEAEKSIKRHETIHWKELLGALSYTLNYPAKYFSAEDMIRLKKKLMPLISLVIAYVPQSSAQELLALHDAGVLKLVAVGEDSKVLPQEQGGIQYHYHDEDGKQQIVYYETFIDCIGQPHLPFERIPYPSLKEAGTIVAAKLKFRKDSAAKEMINDNEDIEIDRDGSYQLKVPGMAINDHFQVVDQYRALNPRIYVMAVPLIGGYNPDYSGLDFCETAATRIAATLLS